VALGMTRGSQPPPLAAVWVCRCPRSFTEASCLNSTDIDIWLNLRCHTSLARHYGAAAAAAASLLGAVIPLHLHGNLHESTHC
jgi:hypothetical protein